MANKWARRGNSATQRRGTEKPASRTDHILVIASTVLASAASLLAVLGGLNTLHVWALWGLIGVLALVGLGSWVAFVVRRYGWAVRLVVVASVVVIGLTSAVAVTAVRHAITEARCDSAGEEVQRGESYMDSNIGNRAIDQYTLAISVCPTAGAYLDRGLVWFAEGREIQALDDFSLALAESHKKDVMIIREVYLKRGELYNRTQDCDQAAVQFKNAIDADPTFDPAYTNLAITRLGERAYPAALYETGQALRLNNTVAESYFVRAKAYVGLGMVKEAEGTLQETLDHIGPNDEGIKSGATGVLKSLRARQHIELPADVAPCRY